jgi:hypothetical protein
MKVLVCGGRDYADRSAVYLALDKLHATRQVSMVIQGGAGGADRMAREWAEERRIHFAEVPALWKLPDGRTDRAAGPARNRAMLFLHPDGVVAFPGGKGTADMVAAAVAYGLKVWHPYG